MGRMSLSGMPLIVIVAATLLAISSPVALQAQNSLPEPVFEYEWGEQGDGDGEFDLIGKVAVRNDTIIYVADRSNLRVQVFNRDGTYLDEIPFALSTESYNLLPDDVAVDGDTIYVLDIGGFIQKFNGSHDLVAEWKSANISGGTLPGNGLGSMAASPNYLYVGSTGPLTGSPPHNNGGILQLTKTGSVAREIPLWDSSDQIINDQWSMTTDPYDNVYVAYKYTLESGPSFTVLKKFDAAGQLLDTRSLPNSPIYGLHADLSGVIYYSSGSHVYVLADSTESLDYEGAGSSSGTSSVRGLAADSLGWLYITDHGAMTERVLRTRIDYDGDGLFDGWEKYGLLANAAGSRRYGLENASLTRKDLYIEVDGSNGHMLTDAAVEDLVAAFDRVPNQLFAIPNGILANGVALHMQRDSLVSGTINWTSDVEQAFKTFKGAHWGTRMERDSGLTAVKRLVSRYAVFTDANEYGVSGIAEHLGNDLLISLGAWVESDTVPTGVQAGAVMHELGHTLGLLHGGVDHENHKPNYYSVMNYTWQVPYSDVPEWAALWRLRYSEVSLPTLQESMLVDSVGIDPGGLIFGAVLCDTCVVPFGPALCDSSSSEITLNWAPPTGAVNWDGNPTTPTCTTCDINQWAQVIEGSCEYTGVGLAELTSPTDWDTVVFMPRSSLAWRTDAHSSFGTIGVSELTYDQYVQWSSTLRDCNYNGVHDRIDIADGASLDVNRNNIPDECEPPILRDLPRPIVGCPSTDIDASWYVDLEYVIDVDVTDPDLAVYCVLHDVEAGVAFTTLQGAVLGVGDTLHAENYDAEEWLASFAVEYVAGCGTVQMDVYADTLLLLRDVEVLVRDLDVDDRSGGSVDRFDVDAWVEEFGGGQDTCFDFEDNGSVTAADVGIMTGHLGHAIPRELFDPNGGEEYYKDEVMAVSWSEGAGDSARVELFLRQTTNGERGLLAHGLADDGSTSISIPLGIPACDSCVLELQHTAGVWMDTSGVEVGSDFSDSYFTVIDTLAPATTTDLTSDLVSCGSVGLTFTASGDDGFLGQALEYDVRYSTSIILNDATFNSATQFDGEPTPEEGGTYDGVQVTGLSQGTKYYFAMKTKDPVGNLSALSNTDSATTMTWPNCGLAPQVSNQPVESELGNSQGQETSSSTLVVKSTKGEGGIRWKITREAQTDREPGIYVDYGYEGGAWRSGPRFAFVGGDSSFALLLPERTQLRHVVVGSFGVQFVSGQVQQSGGNPFVVSNASHSRLGNLQIDSGGAEPQDVQVGDSLSVVYSVSANAEQGGTEWFMRIGGRLSIEQSTAREDATSATPTAFALAQSQPNPFASSTTIRFDLPTREQVKLEIFDPQGRRVARLANGWFPAGFHAVEWDRRGERGVLQPGVYLYRIQAGAFRDQKKLVILP